jgi:membrane protease YdiL (CAAX protease family)
MNPRAATGLQVTFLTFAVILLAAPLSSLVAGLAWWSDGQRAVINRGSALLLGAAVLLAFPALRAACRAALAVPIPQRCQAEVSAVALAQLPIVFAGVGTTVLIAWILGGPAAMAERMRSSMSEEAALARALEPHAVLITIAITAVLAPIVEELVFRGFLYHAWKRQLGAVPAMLLSAATFALYHPSVASSFIVAIVLTCVYQRTGSLRAAMLVHAVHNVLLFYPLMGHVVLPAERPLAGELATWLPHLACLGLVALLLPAYAWLARRGARCDIPPTQPLHAALPR